MTGFRVHRSCAQGLYHVRPDLTCFGKVIGGGLPAAAYAGPAELMDQVAPGGPVYQAGTLSGNPLAMRAGIETLDLLRARGLRQTRGGLGLGCVPGSTRPRRTPASPVDDQPRRVDDDGVLRRHAGHRLHVRRCGRHEALRTRRFFHGMLERGVWLAPSQFEALFVSLAHREAEIDAAAEAAAETLRSLG